MENINPFMNTWSLILSTISGKANGGGGVTERGPKFMYTEKKMLLNQKHFFQKACILWIHKNLLQEAINMLLIL